MLAVSAIQITPTTAAYAGLGEGQAWAQACVLPHRTLTAALCGGPCRKSHFTEQGTEAQRNEVPHPRPPGWSVRVHQAVCGHGKMPVAAQGARTWSLRCLDSRLLDSLVCRARMFFSSPDPRVQL